MAQQINWVCFSCATERGAKIPKGHLPTWHYNKCDLCGNKIAVTQPRDFGKTRHLIEKQ